MNLKKIQLIILLIILSCSRWEYENESSPIEPSAPETYLTLVAVDTIYSTLDSLGDVLYALDEDPIPEYVWDTLTQAFSTITSSKQELHWWGEDPDGDVVGYKYRWSTDTVWTYTSFETGYFIYLSDQI